MSGVVLENLSWKKLIILTLILFGLLITFFLIGGLKGATVEITKDETGVLTGIFFQDHQMQSFFENFPELVLLDATYKLNDLRLPLFVLMCVDGNGESEIISFWIVSDEGRDVLVNMFSIFKKFNPQWERIKCIMADKDMVERSVILEQVPNASLQICLFHVLKTFRREVTCEKLKITSDQRLYALEILQKLAYCKSSDTYDKLYDELVNANVKIVTEYFNSNWHPIKEQWVEGFKAESCNFMNRTNNRVECTNQKLKSVISKFSNIVDFFRDLMKIAKSLRIERNHRAVSVFNKVKTVLNVSDTVTNFNNYMQYITPFAFGHVSRQKEGSTKIEYAEPITPATVAISLPYSEGNVTTTSTSCECGFFTSMELPCKHILFLRKAKGETQFCQELCSSRWTKSYYKRNHVAFVAFQTNDVSDSINVTTTPRRRRVRVLSGQDKYRRVLNVSQKLASVIAEKSMREFSEHLKGLELLVDLISGSKQYSIREVNSQEDTQDDVHIETGNLALVETLGGPMVTISPDVPDSSSEVPIIHDTPAIQHHESMRNDDVNDENMVIPDDVRIDTIPGVAGIDSGVQVETEDALLEIISETRTDDEQLIRSEDEIPLRLPPKIVKRGRPKGAESTVVGLPKKRAARAIPFLKKAPNEKAKAPQPSNVNVIIGTKCYGQGKYVPREKWFIPRGVNACDHLESLSPYDKTIISKGITDKQIVFSFWIPGPRDGHELKMHPQFQYMLSVLQLDIEYQPNNPVGRNPVMLLDFRLGYRDEGDRPDDWKLLAESAEDRKLVCSIQHNESEPGSLYECDLLHAFEISSVHHDYYLLNLRLPPSREKNIHIGQISDVSLVTIHQNGGFTFVWFSIKTAVFPFVLLVLIWFWRRIQQMCRPPNLLERTLFALGISMTMLNLPIEWLTFWLNMPFMLLLNDIRQGAFYAMLLSFWIIFTGEHIMDQTERNRLKLYWKHLAAVVFGCFCLFVFEMCERGMQLKNPFFSIWSSDTGSKLALAFIILAAIAATCYFLFLCYMIIRVFRNISAKKSTLPSMTVMRKKYYMGLIFRFKFLMILTLFCAALTVIFFIVSQLSEGQWKWGDENLQLEYSSAFFTGVYGLWNVYIFGLLSLYAPSHKTASDTSIDTDSQEEEVQLTNIPSETSVLQSFASKTAQD